MLVSPQSLYILWKPRAFAVFRRVIYRSGNKSLLLTYLNIVLYVFLNTFDLLKPELSAQCAVKKKTWDLNDCPSFRVTLAYEFNGSSFSQQYTACRLQATFCTKALISLLQHDKYRIKHFVTLDAVHRICAHSAMLHDMCSAQSDIRTIVWTSSLHKHLYAFIH